jgi:hypothetical protein
MSRPLSAKTSVTIGAALSVVLVVCSTVWALAGERQATLGSVDRHEKALVDHDGRLRRAEEGLASIQLHMEYTRAALQRIEAALKTGDLQPE